MQRCVAFIFSLFLCFSLAVSADDASISLLNERLQKINEEASELKDLAERLTLHAKELKDDDPAAFTKHIGEALQLVRRAENLEKISSTLSSAIENNPTPERLQKIDLLIGKTESEITNTQSQREQLEILLTKEAPVAMTVAPTVKAPTPVPAPIIVTPAPDTAVVIKTPPAPKVVQVTDKEVVLKPDEVQEVLKPIEVEETLEAVKPDVVLTPVPVTPEVALTPVPIETTVLPPAKGESKLNITVTETQPIDSEPIRVIDLEEEFKRRQQETPVETMERLRSADPYGSEEAMKASPEELFLVVEKDFREESGEDINDEDIKPVMRPPAPVPQTDRDLVETVSPEQYAQKRVQELRDRFKDRLDTKLPVLKSIRVYNTETGRERWLRQGDGYSFQAVGFGPRNSIRVKVYDKDDNLVEGDFITLQKNVMEGSSYDKALRSLKALELIRASHHEEAVCKEGQEPDDVFLESSARPRMRPENLGVERDRPGTNYRPGCEVLSDGIQTQDKSKLKQCIRSIQSFIKSNGTNRCRVIQKLFSLNEKEQDFAALVFTTIGEAPGRLPAGSADHLMIMKSLKNRERAVKRAGWREPLNSLDLALVPMHYSMFNNHNGRFASTGFLSSSSNMDNIVESVVEYQNASWHPPGEIDNITHYYSPPAMKPAGRRIWWSRPSQNPNRTLREITGIRVNGQPVVNATNSRNGYHRFFAGVDGPNNYATTRKSRRTLGACR
ncbi:MAG: hypothetical protein VXV96_15420 [Bdellovibrionota bacterium]|nr:hypothetical protein [Bdellovibrionota bacterium]